MCRGSSADEDGTSSTWDKGLSGTAECLLCPLGSPFPLPSEFFPTACIHQNHGEDSPSSLPEKSRAGTSTSAPVSAGNTGPPRYLPLPSLTDRLSPCRLSHPHTQALLLLSWKYDPWISLGTKPQDSGRHPHQVWELVYNKMAAR